MLVSYLPNSGQLVFDAFHLVLSLRHFSIGVKEFVVVRSQNVAITYSTQNAL